MTRTITPPWTHSPPTRMLPALATQKLTVQTTWKSRQPVNLGSQVDLLWYRNGTCHSTYTQQSPLKPRPPIHMLMRLGNLLTSHFQNIKWQPFATTFLSTWLNMRPHLPHQESSWRSKRTQSLWHPRLQSPHTSNDTIPYAQLFHAN
jgi:hypothetical protein